MSAPLKRPSDAAAPTPKRAKREDPDDPSVQTMAFTAGAMMYAYWDEALKQGSDDQVSQACESIAGPDYAKHPMFADVDAWRYEHAIRKINPVKPRGFKWHSEWDEGAADPVADRASNDPDVARWIEMRGQLVMLMEDIEYGFQAWRD